MSMFSRLYKVLYYSLCFCYLTVRFLRRRSFDFEKVRRVLVVAPNQGVGTIILLLPMLKSLKKNRPDIHVTLLSAPKVVGELLAGADCVDDVIIERELLGARLVDGVRFFRREIAPRKFDLAISTFYEVADKIPVWKLFSGAPYRIGYAAGAPSFLDTFTLSWEETTHEVRRNLEIVRFLGMHAVDEELSILLTDADRVFATQYLSSRGIEDGDLVLGVHAGAKADWPEKRWPLENFVRVAQDFAASHGAKLVFFGGPDDEEDSAQLATMVGERAVANRQTIKETAALIGRCTLFLCNDSGLMHVAAAMRVPVVAVFGPTRPAKNHPWGVPYKVVRQELSCSPCYNYGRIRCVRNHECMSRITIEEVEEALETMLRDRQSPVAAGREEARRR